MRGPVRAGERPSHGPAVIGCTEGLRIGAPTTYVQWRPVELLSPSLGPGARVRLAGAEWVVDALEVDVEFGLIAVWLVSVATRPAMDGSDMPTDSTLVLLDL